MMYQIGWGVKSKSRRVVPQPTAWVLMIAIFFCLPSAIFAEETKAEATKNISVNVSVNVSVEEDLPEEVLRAEIYTDARSPVDGKLLTATEYVELMENLRSLDSIPPEDLVSPKVREIVDLLRLRKLLRQFIPFIP